MIDRTTQVLNLGRRMLSDQVDAVRRSAAEQLIMAARIDLDRCPARLQHHVPGACSSQSDLPALSSSSVPLTPPASAAVVPAAEKRKADVPERGSVESTRLVGIENDSAPGLATGSDAASGEGGFRADGSAVELDGENAGFAVATAAAAVIPVGEGGGNGEGTDYGHRVAENGSEELAVAATAAEGEASPPSPSSSSPKRLERAAGAAEEDEGVVRADVFNAVEPLDRVRACGLWLRLVIMPLVVECLDGLYRTKLLALHMAQVGQ